MKVEAIRPFFFALFCVYCGLAIWAFSAFLRAGPSEPEDAFQALIPQIVERMEARP